VVCTEAAGELVVGGSSALEVKQQAVSTEVCRNMNNSVKDSRVPTRSLDSLQYKAPMAHNKKDRHHAVMGVGCIIMPWGGALSSIIQQAFRQPRAANQNNSSKHCFLASCWWWWVNHQPF
jgi:hypothetical protein